MVIRLKEGRGSSGCGNLKEWRKTLFAGKPDRLRFVPQDFPAWNKCWNLCHLRELVRGKEENEKEIVGAERRMVVHLRGDGDRLQDPRAPVFPAEIKASDAEPLPKVMIITVGMGNE